MTPHLCHRHKSLYKVDVSISNTFISLFFAFRPLSEVAFVNFLNKHFSVNTRSPLVQTRQTLLTRAAEAYYNNADRQDVGLRMCSRYYKTNENIKWGNSQHFDTDTDLSFKTTSLYKFAYYIDCHKYNVQKV